ncbi:MAG: GWxTD domain-containing protein [Candidatus Aminicenantes bacterium]|nr:GWxTD domain-containing protein [Candidatus Aminicenantes bacterium]
MKKPIGATLLFILAILCLPARGVSAIPKKDAWYTQHYIIMQDFERKAYRTLSVDGRKVFQELFWAARTQDARAMYQARLEYVKKNFWKENNQQPWNTDRSRVYLLNGSPASIDVDQNSSWPSAGIPNEMRQATDRTNEDVGANRGEVWTYPHSRYFVQYNFIFVQPSQWKVVNSGDRYRGELEDYNKNVTFGIADLEKYKQDLAALDKKK